MKIRIEPDHAKLWDFIQQHDYPCPWSLADLMVHCIPLRIERGDETLAYVWASWSTDGVLDFHACARARWMTPEVLQRLFIIAELFGGHTLQCTPYGDTAPALCRLLERWGFERRGATMTRRIDDGVILRPKHPPAAPAAAAAPATPAGDCDDPRGL